jgi:hypothetical protein
MLRRIDGTAISKTLRVLLACTVFVMFSAMLRIYQDPEAPHDMYPGLESCRHIKDLAKYKFDGEYLIRSDVVAQLASLWSQSDCSRYSGMLRDSPGQATARASQEHSGPNKGRYGKEARQTLQRGPAFDSADASRDFTGSAFYNPVLVGDLPVASVGNMTSLHAPVVPSFSSRTDEVPSPPPRALG